MGLFVVLSPAYALTPQKGVPQETRQYSSEALSLYLDGELYMMQGNHQRAIAAFSRALSYDSTSATIFLRLGEALLGAGRTKGAHKAGLRARDLSHDDAQVYAFLSRVALADQDFPKALDYLEQWSINDVTDLEPLFRKAEVALHLKDYDSAVDTYLQIYDRDPMQTAALDRAGDIAVSVGDLERGLGVYRRKKEANPDDLRAWRGFAEISLQTQRWEEARAAYIELHKRGGASVATELQLAWLYMRAGHLDTARSQLVDLLEQGYRQWNVLSMTSQVASRLEDYALLDKTANLMVNTFPDSVMGYTSLAIARNYSRNNSGAIAILERALERFPDDIDVHYLLANLFYTIERYVEAENHLQVALNLQPEAQYIRQLLASVWSSLERYQSSDSLYEELLMTDDENVVIKNNYAYSLCEREVVTKTQLQYARKLSKASLKGNSDNPSFLDTYGWVLFRLGKFRRAVKYLLESNRIRPGHPVVLDHLARTYAQWGREEESQAYAAEAEAARKAEKGHVASSNEIDDKSNGEKQP